jgi:hypothetical protein
MIRSAIFGLVTVLVIAKVATGLRVTWSNSVERTETASFSPQFTKNYEVQADNGSVELNGQDDTSANVEVTSICRASAHDEDAAAAALDAIEVTIAGRDAETCRIGWRWKTPPHADWSGSVEFKILAPKTVNLRCQTQNGGITVNNVSGTAKLKSQNGRIVTDISGDSLEAMTENGQIAAKYSGPHLQLHTRNGPVSADLSGGAAVDGEIAAQNGSVTLIVGDHTACKLSAATVNGRVYGTADKPGAKPVKWSGKWKRWLKGRSIEETLGSGGETLKVRVQNGAIRIRHAKGEGDSDSDGEDSDD